MQSQVEEFLRLALARSTPRWIVTVERKGTALLRSLVENSKRPATGWTGWNQVLSSEALERAPVHDLQTGVILLLDDGICGGHRMRKLYDFLTDQRGVPRERIRIACFTTHENASFGDVDHRWFGQMTSKRYREVREDVISYFQRNGSLLLDTEHIEVPIRLKCPRLEFFDALCQAGIGVEHVSAAGKINLTIHNPIILEESKYLESLPPGTTIKNAIRKLRVVQRTENEFVIIPIFYPSIPASENRLDTLPPCLSPLASDPEMDFHLVGIFSALHLFKTAFACLRELIQENKLVVRVPGPGDPDDCVSHMRALFPQIDVEELHRLVERLVESGRNYRARRGELNPPLRVEGAQGTKGAEALRKLQWLALKAVAHYAVMSPAEPRGASMAELVRELGSRVSAPKCKAEIEERLVQEALLSAALDKAVDEADLVADVKAMTFVDGVKRMVRVFRFDGELTTSDVVRVASVWRSPNAPPEEVRTSDG